MESGVKLTEQSSDTSIMQISDSEDEEAVVPSLEVTKTDAETPIPSEGKLKSKLYCRGLLF